MSESSKKRIFSQHNNHREINKVRQTIDILDGKLLRLIEERMSLALRLNRLKDKIYDPEREKTVMANFKSYSSPLMNEKFVLGLARQLIKESKRLQRQKYKLIGFQGEKGAYSEEAALIFDSGLITVPCLEFKDVFEAVSQNLLDFGIVPVENSTEGSVSTVGDLLINSALQIVAEINHPIHHCLLSLPGVKLSEIKFVFSHLQALGQCRGFIQIHDFEPRPFYDTAGAARMLSEKQNRSAAAIASKKCARLYGLQVLKENIEDFPGNRTRFLVISKEGAVDGKKCSVIFSTKNEPGALCRALLPLAERKINLTRLESRPNKNHPGEYYFLADFEGSLTDRKIHLALKDLEKHSLFFRFLGCYPVLR